MNCNKFISYDAYNKMHVIRGLEWSEEKEVLRNKHNEPYAYGYWIHI